MFDPTIFDNVKVVIEGAVYDEDLEGQLIIKNRSDIINLAKMSREYAIAFRLPNDSVASCNWVLISDSKQLFSEINETNLNEHGCTTKIEFSVTVRFNEKDLTKVQNIISSNWEQRKIHYRLDTPYPMHEKIQLLATIDFNRVILEEDIDDLLAMFEHIKRTLQTLKNNGF